MSELMYQSNRSLNIPRAYPGYLTSSPTREGENLMNLVFPGTDPLITTHRGWGKLWKTKHLRKRFQNFRQSSVLLTDRIKNHQLQPQVWPSKLSYIVRHTIGLWLVDFDPICLTSFSIARSAEDKTSWKVFCLTFSKSCRDTQVIPRAFASAIC